LLVLTCSSGLATAQSSGGFNYSVTSGNATITGYTGAGGSVVIPASIDGTPVTAIGHRAFYSGQSITSVTIPASVTSIGFAAFLRCNGLTSVTIGRGVTSIDLFAFAFCSGLTNIDVDSTNPAYSSAGGVLFDKNQTTLIQCPGGKSGTYTIPNNVTNIGQQAFASCSSLTSVTIGRGVTSIGGLAFQGCGGLTNIDVGSTNPAYLSAGGVLFDKNQTTLIQCPGGKSGTYTIPNNVTNIGQQAFASCSSLTSVTIGSGVTNIGDGAFNSCIGLTSVTIGSGVTSIGYWAFDQCSRLTNISFMGNAPKYESSASNRLPIGATVRYSSAATGWDTTYGGLPTVADYLDVLTYTTANNQVTITGYTGTGGVVIISASIAGKPVTAIGDRAFLGSSGLTSVTIPTSVTSIGTFAFAYCSGLTSVTIPNSVIGIGNEAFASCTGLISVMIGNGVTNIGDYAFNSCIGLTSVTIPNSVTSIGGGTFASCEGLTRVMIPVAMVPSIDAFPSATTILRYLSDAQLASRDSQQNEAGKAVGRALGQADVTNSPSIYGLYTAAQYADNYAAGRTAGQADVSNAPGTSDFTFNSGTGTITGYTGAGGAVVIPASIDGAPVTAIGDSAFSPAYQGIQSITSVTIPASVTSIGIAAFYQCSGLTSVTIGRGVTSIEGYAFQGCGGLTNIEVDSANPAYSSAGGVLFDKNQTTLIQCPRGKSGTYTIPNSVTNIGGEAFANCSSLTSVTTGSGVTSIGDAAFDSCTGLTSVTIGSGVTSIGGYAFQACSGLTNIEVDSTNPAYSSAGGVLFDKNQTTLIQCPGGKSGTYTIPNSVTSIGDGAFDSCTGLTSLPIGNSVTRIGFIAFRGCTGLTSVAIPNSVTSIGSYAFVQCSGLTSVTIGSGVTSIGHGAFDQCSRLTHIIFMGNAPKYESSAFNGLPNGATVRYSSAARGWGATFDGLPAVADYIDVLTYTTANNQVTITGYTGTGGVVIISASIAGKPVTAIGDRAFLGSSGLTSVTIPTSVIGIGYAAFVSCTGLTSVMIGNGVTNIGDGAFYQCSGLTSVAIPNSVTSIGNYAFFGCSGLTSVTNGSGVTSIGDAAFQDCSSLTSVPIPNSVTNIGNNAFKSCTGLTSVAIPDSVTSIGGNAFASCSGLTRVMIPAATVLDTDAFPSSTTILRYFSAVQLSDRDKLQNEAGHATGRTAGRTDVTDTPASYGLYTQAQAQALAPKAAVESDFTFDSGTGTITGFGLIDSVAVIVPSTIGGVTVTAIGAGAFANCSGLRYAAIPGDATLVASSFPVGTPIIRFYSDAQLVTRDGQQNAAGRTAGQTDVTSAPASYSLYTAAQYSANYSSGQTAGQVAGRTLGQADVTSAPNTYSLYNLSQVQALNVGTPLLTRDAVSKKFKLTMKAKKSTDLKTFTSLPFVSGDSTINSNGEMEFQFSSTDNAAFYRLESH